MIFSERIKLAERINEFIKGKNMSETTFGVLCALEINGYLVESAEKLHSVNDKLPGKKENEK